MLMTQKEVDQKALNLKALLGVVRKMGATVAGKCRCGKVISANKKECRACKEDIVTPLGERVILSDLMPPPIPLMDDEPGVCAYCQKAQAVKNELCGPCGELWVNSTLNPANWNSRDQEEHGKQLADPEGW